MVDKGHVIVCKLAEKGVIEGEAIFERAGDAYRLPRTSRSLSDLL